MLSDNPPDTIHLTNQPEPQPSIDGCNPMLSGYSDDGKEVSDIIIKVKKSNKPKSVRCEVCRKKIGLLVFKCKCSSELKFCSSHVQPELHSCIFDHKTDAIERLSNTLPKVVGDKIIRI
tara:strand:+ start:821 stop:1177 length:357 start_codon:yes stop_codon:yes gene_type:complete